MNRTMRFLLFAGLVLILPAFAIGQTDTLATPPVDTLATSPADTIPAEAAAATEPKEKKEKKKRDHFKPHIGVNFNSLSMSGDRYTSNSNIGFLLGFSYQRGRFFYWEVGADYSSPSFELVDAQAPDTDGSFSLGSIDVPLSAGINILSVTDRLLGLRVFVGVTPSFIINVGSNDLGLTSDDFNSFLAYGHGGIGVDIAFIYLEGIYKFGFGDALKDVGSSPSQVQVILGFRF